MVRIGISIVLTSSSERPSCSQLEQALPNAIYGEITPRPASNILARTCFGIAIVVLICHGSQTFQKVSVPFYMFCMIGPDLATSPSCEADHFWCDRRFREISSNRILATPKVDLVRDS
jgi:hypothetical protein